MLFRLLLDQELISYRYSCSYSRCCCSSCWGRTFQIVVSNRIAMIFGVNVLRVNMHLTYGFGFSIWRH